MKNVGVVPAQVAGGRLVAIAFFGDRQADDAGLRIRDALEHGVGVFLGHHHAQHGSHHAQLFAGLTVDAAFAQGQRVQAVLRRQGVARGGAAQRHAQDAPAKVAAGLDGQVRHHRLMRAMKCPQTQMHDAGREPAAVIGGFLHVCGQAWQRLRIQTFEHG
ncbi:hypothetical protein D3C87_1484780 [compost metagenome]